ncbi:YbbR-like protein [Andreesenia angusta]|uniref:YbbR-like protein n=1 Tax=Andreesenia angusta TaxID=39480 RepID=A0A1S1V638_9FIRM|nr:CdaR family protein [Andreesenia angusta]OHW62121.1 YbbR-like protein [Andreesenia angusta]
MRRIKLNNKKTIVFLSIAISILLWSYVMGDINPSTTKQLLGMNVELIEQEDESLVVTSDKDFKVDVKISGRRNDIYQIRRDDIRFKADLSGYDEGTHTVDVEMESNIRGGTADIDYSPKQIEVTIERIVSKSFKAELVTTGELPSGINPDMLEFPESEVSVTGVRSDVDSVDRVVASLDAGEVKNGQDIEVSLVPLDRAGNSVEGVKLSKSKLYVKVLSADIKIAKIEPKLVGEIPEGYEVSVAEVIPEKVKFIYSGSQNAPAKVDTTEIDISGITESKEIDVELVLPEGMELAEGVDKKVKVKLTVKEVQDEQELEEEIEKTLDYSLSEIKFKNISEDLAVTNVNEAPDLVRVKISGEAQLLEGISKEDIALTVDFSEASEPGIYSLAIGYGEIPAGIRVISVGPESLEFELGAKTD